jgi:short-subunit dehydrogenase
MDHQHLQYHHPYLLHYFLLFLLITILLATTCMMMIWAYFYRFKTRFNIKNRCVIIFGGAQGLGKELAIQCLRKGAIQIIIADIENNEQLLNECRNQIIAKATTNNKKIQPSQIVMLSCDVSNIHQVQYILDYVLKIKIDSTSNTISSTPSLIINCAGIVSGCSFQELTPEIFDKMMKVNLIGHFNIAKIFLPYLLTHHNNNDNGGILVGISSMMGLMGGAKLSDYCATKFGIIGFYESLRLEYLNVLTNSTSSTMTSGVSITTICPYAFDSGMFDGIFEGTLGNRMIQTLFPLLSVDYVASATLRAIERRQTVAIIPEYFSVLVNVVRILPSPLYEVILNIMGGKNGMKYFRGNTKQKNGWKQN